MHDEPTYGFELSAPELADELQIALLRFLLDEHPATLTLDEVLTAFIALNEGAFGERDSIHNAVRDLAAAGLVRRSGEYVVPTRPATRLGQLAKL